MPKPRFSNIQKEDEDFLKLKNYVINSLNRGHKEEEIKQVLLIKSWPKPMIDQVFFEIDNRNRGIL